MKTRCLLLLSLLALVACKTSVRAPTADLHAITDGRLALGVVPSTSSEGMEAYRLLVCKKNAVYDEQVFSNNSICRSALVDNSGQEVVLLPNKLRRSFSTKYWRYAAGVLGVALAAFGVVAGTKWYKAGAKFVDEAVANSEKVLASTKEQERLRAAIAEHEGAIKKHLDKITAERSERLAGREQELVQLRAELDDSFRAAHPETIKKVIAKIKTVDDNFANEVESRLLLADVVDADLLVRLSQRVEETDKVFAHNLRVFAADARFRLGDDGLNFYLSDHKIHQGMYDDMMSNTMRKNAAELMEKKPSGIFDYLDGVVRSKRESAQLTQHAVQLNSLENMKKALFKIRDGEFEDTDAIRGIVNTLESDTALDGATKYLDDLGAGDKFSQKFGRIKDRYQALTDSDFTALLDDGADMTAYQRHVEAAEIEQLYLDNLAKFQAITFNQRSLSAVDRLAKDPTKFSTELARLDEEILAARKVLMEAEASRKYTIEMFDDAAKKEEFWQRMNSLKEHTPEVRREQIAALQRDMDAFEAQLLGRAGYRNTLRNTISDVGSARFSAELDLQRAPLERIAAHTELDALKVALAEAKLDKFREVDLITANMAKRRELWGLRTITAGSGLAGLGMGMAVGVALNNSVWGRGRKQLGSNWNQIFNTDQSFANATPVNDLPAIIRSISEIFGVSVNANALSL